MDFEYDNIFDFDPKYLDFLLELQKKIFCLMKLKFCRCLMKLKFCRQLAADAVDPESDPEGFHLTNQHSHVYSVQGVRTGTAESVRKLTSSKARL